LAGKGRGLVDPAKVELNICKIFKAGSRVRMFFSQDLLQDPERFLVERLGFGIFARRPVQQGQVIEALRRVGMFWPKNLLPDPERFLVERLEILSKVVYGK
jgi:hypothetical protein